MKGINSFLWLLSLQNNFTSSLKHTQGYTQDTNTQQQLI